MRRLSAADHTALSSISALAMGFLYDIRSAARLLWRRPGFAIVAVVLLAAGIGAWTLTFTLFDAVFLRPLPVPDAHELVRFVTRHPVVGTRSQFPYQLYREWRDSATAIDVAFAEASYTAVLTDPGPVEFVDIGMVTPEYFSALGVQALHGRTLTVVDQEAVAETPPAILSHAFWQRRFGDDTGVLGRSIAVNDAPFVVVGVMPPDVNGVTPAYFSAMGMQLLAGQDFVASDDASVAPAPVVVNQALVRRYFPDVDPIGETFGTGRPVAQASFRIIGVVNDAKYRSLREPIQPTVYVPDRTSSTLIVRTRSQARSVIEPVRLEIESLDPGLPIMEVHTLADEVASSVAVERLLATLATVVALSAAVLTAVGIYGLFAQVVAERRRELSLRVALGATHRELGLLVGREAALLIVPGLAVGLLAMLLGSRWIESLLYDIAPHDPGSLAAATLLVAFAGAAGTWIPAPHAIRTDAAAGLRLED